MACGPPIVGGLRTIRKLTATTALRFWIPSGLADNSAPIGLLSADLVAHAIIRPTSHAPDSRNDPRAV